MGATRKLAAILVSDVVGYSRLAGADEDRILARLRTLRSDLIDPTIAVHRGRIVKRTGDGSIIEFRSVVDAVRCAIDVQNGLIERNAGLPPEKRIEFRVGIHVGDVVEESDGDLMGDVVNIAARLEGVAKPGGICLSEQAYLQVKGRLDLAVTDLGPTELKNIAEPIRVYSLEVGVPAQRWMERTIADAVALGIVFVLLIGEIDLSAGSVSGVTSAAMVVLNINLGWSPVAAILVAVVFGATIGLLHGLIFTKLGVPSFVLTLGGLLAWQGAQLLILGDQGTINIPYDGVIASLANTVLPSWLGYGIAATYFATAFALIFRESRLRADRGLPPRPLAKRLLMAATITALILGATIVFSLWRGISLVFLIFAGLVALVDVVLSSTTFGRKLFAVGGNAEAARRAGIGVDGVKIAAFVLCSTFAAFGGVLAASRLFAVNQASGGSDTLLNAIAAAVIGGTSLFGGRGSGYSALLGMLVIGSVSNGMDLLNQPSDVKYVITGIVLVAAVVIDSLARRERKAAGR